MTTLSDQIKCAERELSMRRSVYPRQVIAMKMSKAKAEKEIEGMKAIIKTLKRLRAETVGDEVDMFGGNS